MHRCSSTSIKVVNLIPFSPFSRCLSSSNCTAMQKLLLLLGLLICQACALEEFTIGFGEKEYCAVEGGSFEFCIVAVTGEASGNFSIIVERIYEQGTI